MTEAQATDIEIYIEKLTLADAVIWLETVFGSLSSQKKRKGMPKKAQPFLTQWEGHDFQIIVFEDVIPGYTSIWLDNAKLPWKDDKACALSAAKELSKIVRITAGGWEDQGDTDNWLEIYPDSSSKEIIWKT